MGSEEGEMKRKKLVSSQFSNFQIKTMNIGIIGAGTMGVGLAQVAATAGCKVVLFDANAPQIDKALTGLEKTLQKLTEKGKISQEKAIEIRNNIVKGEALQDLKAIWLSKRSLKTKTSKPRFLQNWRLMFQKTVSSVPIHHPFLSPLWGQN